MTARGFASIGLIRPKNINNIGAVMRASHIFGAALVAVQGDRTPVTSCQDVTKAWRSLPVLRVDDIFQAVPYDTVPVAVDLVPGAKSLVHFVHPDRAFYIFGPEDGTLGRAIVDRCALKVMIPSRHCLNLAACTNVVLYDRMAKRDEDLILSARECVHAAA